MAFFNRKEEVLDVEITQFGKYLLSKGIFRPSFYSFFDDDILYDAKFAGVTAEHQNEIEPRIKETPRLKTQYVFSGIETEINRSVEEARAEAVVDDSLDRNVPPIKLIQPTSDRHYAVSAPLGNSKLGSEKAPAWRVYFLKGELSGSVEIQTGTKQPSQPIPQLSAEVTYRTSVRTQLEDDEELEHQEFVFDDGTYIHMDDDSIVLEISELNGRQANSEFEIEVYEVEEEMVNGVLTGKEILNPLNFQRPVTKNYKITPGNIYVPEPVDTSVSSPVDITNVEYFLDMDFDGEIDEALMCKLNPVDKAKGIFSSRTFKCEDALDRGERENIYSPSTVFEDQCDD
jgi:hypothetical protein